METAKQREMVRETTRNKTMMTPVSIIKPLWVYLKESRAEMKKVSWPSRQDVVRLTLAVIIASVVVAAILGAFDYVFDRAVITLFTRFKQ